jgi:hypothetical protein
MNVDESYINSLSVEELRRELIDALEVQYGVLFALRDAPEMPSPFVLKHLGTVANWPDDHNRGKLLQRTLGLDVIPPKSECESGAGLWSRIHAGLVGANGQIEDKK